jgi:GNAT superfamily N-acetyltransferase
MIEIVESRYYAEGIRSGVGLPAGVKTRLVEELEKRDNIHTVLPFVDGEAAGVTISIESFSTFLCKPILNIHDVVVSKEFRGRGISKMMLVKAEEIALRLGCCKLTLEVLGKEIVTSLKGEN